MYERACLRQLGAAEAGERERDGEELSFPITVMWLTHKGEDTEEDNSERGVMKINNKGMQWRVNP